MEDSKLLEKYKELYLKHIKLEGDFIELVPCNGRFKNNNKGFEWRGSI